MEDSEAGMRSLRMSHVIVRVLLVLGLQYLDGPR
jgi:hypothetical protein